MRLPYTLIWFWTLLYDFEHSYTVISKIMSNIYDEVHHQVLQVKRKEIIKLFMIEKWLNILSKNTVI